MKLLLPIDFTVASVNALQYANDLVQDLGTGDICLLHIVGSDKEQALAHEQLRDWAERHMPAGAPVEINVTVAKRVFDIIGSIANDCGASMVIMGTQGAKGSQRFLGSHAVKAITNSSVPFIVVQKEMPVNHSIRKIVVPISMETEEKKILNIVVALAKPLKAKVALFYEVKSDEFLAKGIQNNLGFAIKHLQAEGIECSATAAPMNERFEQEVVDFTTAVHGDLIAMINKNQDGYWGLFGLNVDQNLIENDAHIPVLTVDAKPQGFMGNVFSV